MFEPNDKSKTTSPEIGSTDLFTNKDVFLIKLPKELLKYHQKTQNLSFDFKKLKNGERFVLDAVEYEASLIKEKMSLKCFTKNGESFNVVDSFRYLIQIKRYFDIPSIKAPVIEPKRVQVPTAIENYLEKKVKTPLNTLEESKNQKKAEKKSKKHKSNDELDTTIFTLKKKIKQEKI